MAFSELNVVLGKKGGVSCGNLFASIAVRVAMLWTATLLGSETPLPCFFLYEELRQEKAKSGRDIAIVTPRTIVTHKVGFSSKMQIYDRETDEHIGWIVMFIFDGDVRVAPHIEENHRRQGYMTEVKYAALKYAFEVLGATHSTAVIPKAKFAAAQLHRKLGYRLSLETDNTFYFLLTRHDFREADIFFNP